MIYVMSDIKKMIIPIDSPVYIDTVSWMDTSNVPHTCRTTYNIKMGDYVLSSYTDENKAKEVLHKLASCLSEFDSGVFYIDQ